MDLKLWEKGVALYAEIIKKNPKVASVTRIIPTRSPYTDDDEKIAVIISTDKVLKEFSSDAMRDIIEIVNLMDGFCSISLYNNKPAVYLY